jgi:hypothetical protein
MEIIFFYENENVRIWLKNFKWLICKDFINWEMFVNCLLEDTNKKGNYEYLWCEDCITKRRECTFIKNYTYLLKKMKGDKVWYINIQTYLLSQTRGLPYNTYFWWKKYQIPVSRVIDTDKWNRIALNMFLGDSTMI